jgi:hypothetical protein
LGAALLLALLLAGLLLALPGRGQAQSGISSPAAGSTISGDVPVMGTAVIDPFQKYELHYKLEPSGDDGYVYFDGNTSPVTNGQLGIWRAAGLPGGVYTLRLRVVKADGNYAEFYAPNLSVNQGPPPTPTSETPTVTPTSATPTATFTPYPTSTPVVGSVQQPALEAPPTPTPATVEQPALPAPAEVAAAPVDAAAVPPAGSTPVAAAPGDLAPSQASAVVLTPSTTIVDPTTETSNTRALGQALSLNRLRTEFYRGIRFSAALLLLAVAIYGGKRIFDWTRRRYG